MDGPMLEEISKLVALAVRLNRPGFTVFVSYSGHVHHMGVSVCPEGWGQGEQIRWDAYLSGSLAVGPGAIREIAAWLQGLSDRAGMAQCPRCGRRGLPSAAARKPEAPVAGTTPSESPARPAAPGRTVERSRRRVRLSREEKAALMARIIGLREAGRSISRIAAELRIPAGTVSRMVWEHRGRQNDPTGIAIAKAESK